jgi:excisionase family DNA binding protein
VAGRKVDSGSSEVQARYLTLDDVATFLSISHAQAYALVRSGELPGIKLGGRGVWRVDRNKLDDYLENLEKTTREWALSHPLTTKDRDKLAGDSE